jgi:hypothetical protein
MPKKGILIVRTDVFPEIETEWNNWYNTKHIPARLQVSGFLTARRFVPIERKLRNVSVTEDEPKYFTLYDLSSVDVITSEAYLKLQDREASLPPESFEAITPKLPKFSRGLYEQIYPEQGEYRMPGTEIMFALGFDVPSAKEEEFNAWYNTEHIPAMNRVPGFVTARRFVAAEAQFRSRTSARLSGPNYVTLYDLENEKVLESDAFMRERESPWRSWIDTWLPLRFRLVVRRIYPEQAGN